MRLYECVKFRSRRVCMEVNRIYCCLEFEMRIQRNVAAAVLCCIVQWILHSEFAPHIHVRTNRTNYFCSIASSMELIVDI